MKLKTLAIAAALLASVGAHAGLENGANGNSSVVFIGFDGNNDVQVTIDLGISLSDFTLGTAFTTGMQAGDSFTWNFATNTTNAQASAGNAWSTAYSAFKAAQSGNDFKWAVIAMDDVSGSTGTQNRNALATGNATVAQMLAHTTSTPVSNAVANGRTFLVAVNNFGNLITADNGAAVTTSANGNAFIGNAGAIGGNLNGSLQWNYLLNNGESSTFQNLRQFPNPTVTQFGTVVSAADTLNPSAITFTFDINTDTLTLAAPIPEPQTYALMLAGLGAIGFLARRRRGA